MRPSNIRGLEHIGRTRCRANSSCDRHLSPPVSWDRKMIADGWWKSSSKNIFGGLRIHQLELWRRSWRTGAGGGVPQLVGQRRKPNFVRGAYWRDLGHWSDISTIVHLSRPSLLWALGMSPSVLPVVSIPSRLFITETTHRSGAQATFVDQFQDQFNDANESRRRARWLRFISTGPYLWRR